MSVVQTAYPNTHGFLVSGQIVDTINCDVDSMNLTGSTNVRFGYGRAYRLRAARRGHRRQPRGCGPAERLPHQQHHHLVGGYGGQPVHRAWCGPAPCHRQRNCVPVGGHHHRRHHSTQSVGQHGSFPCQHRSGPLPERRHQLPGRGRDGRTGEGVQRRTVRNRRRDARPLAGRHCGSGECCCCCWRPRGNADGRGHDR